MGDSGRLSHLLERYLGVLSYSEFYKFLEDIASPYDYVGILNLRLLYRYVHFKEERIAILTMLGRCKHEKSLSECLLDFSYTQDTEELMAILNVFYKYPDSEAKPRICQILKTHKEIQIKIMCVKILAKIGGQDLYPLFDSIFDLASSQLAAEIIKALVLIGKKINISEWKKRIIKHKRGNLFLKEKQCLSSYLSLVYHCGQTGREETLSYFCAYPEGDIALLSASYRALLETEEYLIGHEKRKKEYHEELFNRLIGNTSVKAKDEITSEAEVFIFDRYAFAYITRHSKSIGGEVVAFAENILNAKYSASHRVVVSRLARLNIDFINQFLWKTYLISESKMLLAAILDNMLSHSKEFTEEVCLRLKDNMIHTDSKALIARIPQAIVRLKGRDSIFEIVELLRMRLGDEKEEFLIKALYSLMIYRGGFDLLDGHSSRVFNEILSEIFMETYSVKVKEIAAALASRLRMSANEDYILSLFLNNEESFSLVESLLDLKTPKTQEALRVYISKGESSPVKYLLSPIIIKHFALLKTEMLSDEDIISFLNKPLTLSYAAFYASSHSRHSLIDNLREKYEDERVRYIDRLNIMEALGNLRDKASLNRFAHRLDASDPMGSAIAAEAIHKLKMKEGFETILSFAANPKISDEIKIRILRNSAVVFDDAVEAIVKVSDIMESAQREELKRLLVDIRLQIELEDRLKTMSLRI